MTHSPRRTPAIPMAACALCVALAAAPAAAAPTSSERMPPYRGRAVDRIPAGKIQHIVLEEATTTTKDGAVPPPEEHELNLTQRVESWNSRTRGRLVTSLAAGRFVSDGTRSEVPVGGIIDEYSLRGTTCQRWQPDLNVITRWRCTGVNDRDTAVLEHAETGLAHHYRHRARSFYEITSFRREGRRMLRFRSVFDSPAGDRREAVGEVPEGAPRRGSGRTVRVAYLLKSTLRLVSETTTSTHEVDGHVYRRVTKTRVVARELLTDSPANRKLLRMRHPEATVKRRARRHEQPS